LKAYYKLFLFFIF